MPRAVLLSGMFFVTTAPAAMMELVPTNMPGRIVAFAPTSVWSPIVTLPQSVAPGAMCAHRPIVLSCSMVAFELMIEPRLMCVLALIMAPGPTKMFLSS